MKRIQLLFTITTAICFSIILFIFSCDNSSKSSEENPTETLICVNGEVRRCGSNIGVCMEGTQVCVDGSWSDCEGGVGSSTEQCDNLDNDCDGLIDEDYNVGEPCLTEEGPCGGGIIECSGVDDPAVFCSTESGGSSFIGSELECGDSITSTTEGNPNNAENYTGCTNRIIWPGSESVYAFHCESDRTVEVSLTELSADLDLLLLGSDCAGSGCKTYSAQARTSDEIVTFEATSGNTYYFIVDSRDSAVTGTYRISVICH